MSKNQTPVETAEVTKIDLKAIQEDLGLGAALDVSIHSALKEAHQPSKETRAES